MSEELEVSRKATRDHIRAVQANMADVIGNLNDRAENHDRSKLHEPEASGFWEMQQRTPLSQMVD